MDEKALNMYIRLYEEESGDPSIEHTLQGIAQCQGVGAEIEKLLAGDGLPPPTDKEAQRYHQVQGPSLLFHMYLEQCLFICVLNTS